MPKSHEDVVLLVDQRFIDALQSYDLALLQELVEYNFVYTNENGKSYYNIMELPIVDSPLRFNAIEVLERKLTIFLTVAIVTTLERRIIEYDGIEDDTIQRLNRIWKFNGTNWRLLSATAHNLDC